MFKTKIDKAMDKMVKAHYEFMKAVKELEDCSGIVTKNSNMFLSTEEMSSNREELVRRINNATKDALGKWFNSKLKLQLVVWVSARTLVLFFYISNTFYNGDLLIYILKEE